MEWIFNYGKNWRKSTLGSNDTVNAEFVAANPTGPLHVGHARGAVFGDVLSSLLEKTGYEVTREYYINEEALNIYILMFQMTLRQ